MKHKFDNIFLVGPMGSGKSTTGKRLAKLIGYDYYDSDNAIVENTGVDISWIFEREGEAGFRQRERNMIRKLCQETNIVLATGGGAIISPANQQQLQTHGIVVYLKVSLETQLQRISHKKNQRPLFAAMNSSKKLQELNRIRDPIYKSVADILINTDNHTPTSLAEQINLKVKAFKNNQE